MITSFGGDKATSAFRITLDVTNYYVEVTYMYSITLKTHK